MSEEYESSGPTYHASGITGPTYHASRISGPTYHASGIVQAKIGDNITRLDPGKID